MKTFPYTLFALLLLWTFVWVSCDDSLPPEDHSSSGPFSEGLGLSSDAGGGYSGGGNGDSTKTYEPGVITAGEWNDLKQWDYWKSLMDTSTHADNRSYWGFYPSNRYDFLITDGNRWPIANAELTLHHDGHVLWTTRTDNRGKAVAWAYLFDGQNQPASSALTVSINGQMQSDLFIADYSQGVNIIDLPYIPKGTNKLDIAFVVDATGSMGDELEYLKVEVTDVINRVRSDYPGTVLRMGSVFYRDEGDEYVTRSSPLSSAISGTVNFIKSQSSGGGGDFPEAVHTALEEALTTLDWDQSAKSRVIFLILDAPPHYEPQVIESYKLQITRAAQQGIKIIPITASGIDKATEFLMRFSALSTNGTYAFITDHSGIGGDHLEATVGDYEVEFLNDLMVRLISDLCITERAL